jgi:glycosyltransferase involved in cell wall biosynthesis
LPVVATAVGGIGDVVQHDQTGFIVAANSPSEVARAISRLVNDDSLAERFGAEGRRQAMLNYTREISASRFHALYQRLLG